MASLVKYKLYNNKYKVYENGDIYSLINNKFLKPYPDSSGYLTVRLSGKMFMVHKIVMLLFVGECNGLVVDHLDGNKLNNNLSNLEYVTRSENLVRMNKMMDYKNKNKNHKPVKVLYRGEVYSSQRELAKRLNIASTTISTALKRGYKLLGYEITKVTTNGMVE